MITGKNYIGEQMLGSGEILFQTYNPVLNIPNEWKFIEASPDEVIAACELANKAFKTYRNKSEEERAQFLDAIAQEIENLGNYLLEVYTLESGLDGNRAQTELGRTLFQLRSYAAFIRSSDWSETIVEEGDESRLPLPKPALFKTQIPLGPVVVFGSSNFPFAYSTAGGDTASALAAGCPVIVKSHPMHAGTGELVASAIIRAAQKTGMPDGVFSNLNSKGIEVGIQLVDNVRIKAVGFTGSIQGGRAIFDRANLRPEPIPVFAEMGSINPVIMLSEAIKKDGSHWAKLYAKSITNGSGQFCTNPGLLIGVKSVELSKFKFELANELEAIEPTCMLHPKIKISFEDLKMELSSEDGVTVYITNQEAAGNFAGQTLCSVSGKHFRENPKLHKEVFGPFSLIVECEDMTQLLSIIEELDGQLTGTIIAHESEYDIIPNVVDVLQQKVGRIILNGVPTGVEVSKAMHHGGPYPASTDSRFTAVGVHSIRRWIRPVTYQNFPKNLISNL